MSFRIVVVIIAAVFNVVAVIAVQKHLRCFGHFLQLRSCAFVFFSVFLVPSIILCFIGYSKLKDAQTELNESNDNEPIKNRQSIHPADLMLFAYFTANSRI